MGHSGRRGRPAATHWLGRPGERPLAASVEAGEAFATRCFAVSGLKREWTVKKQIAGERESSKVFCYKKQQTCRLSAFTEKSMAFVQTAVIGKPQKSFTLTKRHEVSALRKAQSC